MKIHKAQTFLERPDLQQETTKQRRIKHVSEPSPPRRGRHDSPELSLPRKQRHDSSDESPLRKQCRDSPDLSPPRRGRRDSPDLSPPRQGRRNSPDPSPKRVPFVSGKKSNKTLDKSQLGRVQGERAHLGAGFSHTSTSHHKRQITADLSPPRKNRDNSHVATSPSPRKRTGSPDGLKKQSSQRGSSPANKKPKQAPSPKRSQRRDSDSSSPRKSFQDCSDSDLSPPRSSRKPGLLHRDSPSKLSPPKRNWDTSSDSDLSPPRRSQAAGKKDPGSRSPLARLPPSRGSDSKRFFQEDRGEDQKASQMLSGGKAGLVSASLLRKEQQELRRHDKNNKHLEDESQNAETVFRDKSGRRRDLTQERLEQQKKVEAKSERDELYAKWGKGLAQSRQQQQNVEDAVKEMQKPLARYIDDKDLDQMLREQEREGDPMANFIRKRKAKESKEKKEKPRYNGPAPPLNRFNIWPGYRWDGVDRSNGFEQKRFARLASKKAVQELAYKWSVEDM
ncbi:BUD13 homolog isoform X2 [Carettochelys insculpta]|uniref:BUD13 homolog isoform X2 n=1 Tax=Carettochelys insculpta TaxID=44489 RepID=UPI003EC02138